MMRPVRGGPARKAYLAQKEGIRLTMRRRELLVALIKATGKRHNAVAAEIGMSDATLHTWTNYRTDYVMPASLERAVKAVAALAGKEPEETWAMFLEEA